MECKFIKHGIALAYDQVLKPCCCWKVSPDWQTQNHISKYDISSWNSSPQMRQQQDLLHNDIWSSHCQQCKQIEDQGRYDSMRGMGNQAYADYKDDDITLEIRPGNTCNFACQTCWPEASSRVAQFHSQAGLIDINSLNSNKYKDFEFLMPIAHRIKDVIVLGGEPFYDKQCLKFLSWAQTNLSSHVMMFTNGSMIDQEFLDSYKGRITLIFSLDAVGRPAEYVRYGTVWSDIINNYAVAKNKANVDIRVNVTCSVYNYFHLEDLVEFLCQDWPSVVTFGQPNKAWYKESVIPKHLREQLITRLHRAIQRLKDTNIESGQQSNAVNALQSIVDNLGTVEFNKENHEIFCEFVDKMDRVKNIKAVDYCTFLSRVLEQEIA